MAEIPINSLANHDFGEGGWRQGRRGQERKGRGGKREERTKGGNKERDAQRRQSKLFQYPLLVIFVDHSMNMATATLPLVEEESRSPRESSVRVGAEIVSIQSELSPPSLPPFPPSSQRKRGENSTPTEVRNGLRL
jgi:hypothetical protein